MAVKKRILLAVGGSGGHLFAAEKIANELKHHDVHFIGVGLDDSEFFKNSEYSHTSIKGDTLTKANGFKNVIALKRIFDGYRLSRKFIKKFNPDLIIGFGSFHSFPPSFAAIHLNTPLVLFEPNAIFGRVNKFLAKKAKFTAVQFYPYPTKVSGDIKSISLPIKEEITSIEDARSYFGLDRDKKTVLIFGGSQGAKSLNEIVPQYLKGLDIQVIHIIGKNTNMDEIHKLYESLQIKSSLKVFEDNMPLAYRACDFAICRSGACTLSELIHYGVPTILVPYPFATDNHQLHNAEFFQTIVKGGFVIEQLNLKKDLDLYLKKMEKESTLLSENIVLYKVKNLSQTITKALDL